MVSVVIAGDVPLLRSLMRMAIEDIGYTVLEEVSEVDDLLAICVSRSIGIIILDLHLSEKEVVNVIESILDVNHRLSVVVVSDFLEEYQMKALSAGARAYIQKPFSIYDLITVLRKVTPVF